MTKILNNWCLSMYIHNKMRHLSLPIITNLLYFSKTCRKYFMFSDKKEKKSTLHSSNNDLTKIYLHMQSITYLWGVHQKMNYEEGWHDLSCIIGKSSMHYLHPLKWGSILRLKCCLGFIANVYSFLSHSFFVF